MCEFKSTTVSILFEWFTLDEKPFLLNIPYWYCFIWILYWSLQYILQFIYHKNVRSENLQKKASHSWKSNRLTINVNISWVKYITCMHKCILDYKVEPTLTYLVAKYARCKKKKFRKKIEQINLTLFTFSNTHMRYIFHSPVFTLIWIANILFPLSCTARALLYYYA